MGSEEALRSREQHLVAELEESRQEVVQMKSLMQEREEQIRRLAQEPRP